MIPEGYNDFFRPGRKTLPGFLFGSGAGPGRSGSGHSTHRGWTMAGRTQDNILLFLKGGAIGVANIIPGVSGGTMAVVLGLYDRLIEAIACFFDSPKKRKEYLLFLIVIGAGAAAAILMLANLLDYLLKNHYQATIYAFLGLIIGGIPAIWKSHGDMKPGAARVLFFILGMLVVILPSLFGEGAKEAAAGAEVVFPTGGAGYSTLLLAAFLAGGAMIVPGISGSFILVLLGQYAVIIAAIKAMAVPVLGVVAIGAGVGVLVFSKIIKVCLSKAPATTYYFILGLLAASIWEIYPGIPGTPGVLVSSLVTLILGAAVSFWMSRVSPG